MADALPTGTVTFLFTDIERSTRLAERLGQRYQALLEDHRGVIRAAFRSEGGREVNTEGDSFFVSFSSAACAVRAALAAQRALQRHDWPDGAELRVRMGVHTGEATMVGHDYVGLEVHRAARIAAAAHGDQIVLSDATWRIVRDAVGDDVEFRDLGEHRLKDLSRPERIFQLVAPDLPTDFPPLRSLNAIANNLPTQLTSFIGREDVVAKAKPLLASARALTLTGPGGTGKTRLGLQLAAEVLHDFSDGAYYVALASISDPSLVAPTIAQTLGLQQTANVSAVDSLVDHLRDKRLLLVLDNFEQLIPAAPVVSQLLKASPGLKAIVTSRSPLHISGEQEFPVPALELPPSDARRLPPEALTRYEAVALFIERAVAVKPDFRVTSDNAPAVAAICTRLDGLPLAIELAAARIKLLTPQAMLARLEHGLGMLVAGGAELPARQRTLRNTIAWSHDLLEPSAQRMFTRFGVFVGGARLEEIEALCGPADELGDEVLDGLAGLVDQSLVRQGEEDAEPRFLMLETIREFALERLVESGEEDAIRRRHAQIYIALAERAEPELTGDHQREWLDRLEHDHDNVRTAIGWASRAGEPQMALRLAAAQWRFWQMRGFLNEAQERLEGVLSLPGVDGHPRDLAKAHEAAGGVAYWQGDLERSRTHYEACLALQREHGDDLGVANALYNLPFPKMVGWAALGDTEAGRADRDWVLALFGESLAIYREHADERGIAKVLWAIGGMQSAYDLDAAKEASLESLRLYRGLRDRFGVGWSLRQLGAVGLRAGEFRYARPYLAEALALFAESRDVSGVTLLLNDMSRLEIGEGRAGRGARIAGAAAALQATSGTDLASLINEVMGSGAGGEPDEAALAAEWQEGQQMGLDDAVEFALKPRPAAERAVETGRRA